MFANYNIPNRNNWLMYQENAYLCMALRYYNDGIKICKTILQGMYQDIELLGFAFIAPKYPDNSYF